MRALLPSILVASLVGVMLIPNAFAVDVVPSWIKNNAGWWADGEIDDQTFVNGMQFLIKEEIIQVSDTTSASNNSEFIPEWVKNTAGWWADDKISEVEFVNAIQYLIRLGLIKIDEDSSGKINYDYPTYNQLMNDPNLSLNTVFDKKIFDGVMNNPNLSSTEKIILADKMTPRIAGYRGATFDGESVYFAPYYNNYGRHGLMIQYNTTQPFDDSNSWNVYNIGRVCAEDDCAYAAFIGFQGALYHNGFVYYVPYFIDETPRGEKDRQPGSFVLRYDTSLDFRDFSAWKGVGHWGAYEDGIVAGDYLYFSPHLDKNNERHTIPLRYDTTKHFEEKTSWVGVKLGLNASYIGAAYDGKKIYYAPWEDDDQEGSSILRYDTEQSFFAKSAWDFLPIPYLGYSGAGFNGTHVVFAPCWCSAYPSESIESSKIMFLNVDTQEVSFSTLDYGAYNGVVEADDALYLVADTTKNGVRSDFIEVTNSIKTFSPTIAKGGYWGGIFDGQYVYFAPYDNPSLEQRNGEFLRYDTAKPFEDDASWESISFAVTDFKYDFEFPTELDIFSKEWIFAASQNKR